MESELDGLSANLKMPEIQWRGGATPVVSMNNSAHTMWVSWERSPFIQVSLRKCSVVLFLKQRYPNFPCAGALPPHTCGCVWVGRHLLPIRKVLCFQTCPLTWNREILIELKLDKNHLYHHGNTNHSSYSWHTPNFPEQWEQKYAPLNLSH